MMKALCLYQHSMMLRGWELEVLSTLESPSFMRCSCLCSYGGALLPGEGQAIAQYVQQNKRVPRRGEVGWQGEEIDELEQAGYVMSGSRHSRMNAIRLRKENQVYTAEEKRALAMLNYEQQKQKEARLVAEMRALVDGEPMPADLPDEQPSAVAVAMAAQLGLNAQEPVDEGPKRAPI